MPATINGIGTSYYGKKNATQANGICDRCKQPSALASYETGHYFVVLFIPLIPLGRKQIIDYCPRCSGHRVMPLRQWTELKQQTLAQSTDNLASHVSDAGAALQHLLSLTAFGELADAKELAIARVRYATAQLRPAMKWLGELFRQARDVKKRVLDR